MSLKLFRGEAAKGVPRVGARLDKYRITKRMGQGGFSTVFAATDLIEDRRVALKIPDLADGDEATMEHLHRETRIMARMDHPTVLPLKDARYINGHFVMVFPLGEETLDERLERRIKRVDAMAMAMQLIDAVAYLHRRKILHRDIKPENFLVFADGSVQLGDFGLARWENQAYDISASGTLGYIAPEQAMGKPTFRSDVFSLGLVLYRLFAGEVPEYPFTKLPAFNKLRRGLSQDFVALIRKSLDPTPSRRFRDASAMHNAALRIRNPLSYRAAKVSIKRAA